MLLLMMHFTLNVTHSVFPYEAGVGTIDQTPVEINNPLFDKEYLERGN